MESELPPEREALRSVDAIRSRKLPAPRGHAALQLAYTVFFAAYVGVVVYTASAQRSTFGSTMLLILPPVVISSGLLGGANERFRARRRAGVGQWISSGCFAIVLFGLLFWGLFRGPGGDGFPWWLTPIAVVSTLLIFGIPPLRVLLRSPGAGAERRVMQPLSRPVRVTTTLIGGFLGASAATALLPSAALVSMVFGIFVVVSIAAVPAPWGLARAGYEWRLPQWAGFGIAALTLFALALLITATDIVSRGVAVWAGVVVAVSIMMSTFVPRRRRGTPAT